MTVISFANKKGGLGKSSITTNLAVSLCLKGHSVLVIDADAQCNSTSTFCSDYENMEENLYSLLTGTSSLEDTVQNITDNLYLIPSSPSLSFYGIEKDDQERAFALKNILKSDFLKGIEYVLIDNPPIINDITLNTFLASDFIIGVTQANEYSFQGIKALWDNVDLIKKTYDNNNLKILGIAVNMFHCRRSIENEYLSKLKNNYKDYVFNSTISDSSIVAYALSLDETATSAFPESKISMQLEHLLTEIQHKLKEAKNGDDEIEKCTLCKNGGRQK